VIPAAALFSLLPCIKTKGFVIFSTVFVLSEHCYEKIVNYDGEFS